MKSRLYSLSVKLGSLAAAMMAVFSVISVKTACMWLTYQPEEPEEIRALKKR
ncbi:MAG: cyclic lactone autoinducer peptide [Ruminococcus flavefaciens]|nr:MAG: hypothetical protein BWZ04_01814 [Firmicutes bacterium ADurb.BinA205]